MGYGGHLQLRLAPSKEVEIGTDGTHTGQRSHTLLLVFAVATVAKVAVGADDDGVRTLGGGCVNRAADVEAGQGLDGKVLHRVTLEFAHLREDGLQLDTLLEQLIDPHQAAGILSDLGTSGLQCLGRGVERKQILYQTGTLSLGAAMVLVGLDFIIGGVLLDKFVVKHLQHVVHRLFDRVGPDA